MPHSEQRSHDGSHVEGFRFQVSDMFEMYEVGYGSLMHLQRLSPSGF